MVTLGLSAAQLIALLVGFGMLKADMVWLKSTVEKHDKKIYNGMSTDLAILMDAHRKSEG